MQNNKRILAKIIQELAQKHAYTLTLLSHTWLMKLEKNGIVRHIFGYNFELNSATTKLLANDKNATAVLLAHSQIPCIEHELFLNPTVADYVPHTGNWKKLMDYAQQFDYKVVVKSNKGSGGSEVYKVDNQLSLELAVSQLFKQSRGITISPFYELKNELRFFILDGKCLLSYQKERPCLVGDGQSTLWKLLTTYTGEHDLQFNKVIQNIGININWQQVLPKGERHLLNWKHNLGKGASVKIVDNHPATSLALSAAKALNIRFGTVDIAELAEGYKVLEINSGVMMENFARFSEENYQRAFAIYEQAVEKMFMV